MTHSLHREGCLGSLKGDFVMITRTSKVNRHLAAQHLSKVAEIIFEAGANNTGSSGLRTNIPLGLEREDFIKRISTMYGFLCTFSSKEQLREVLRKLKEADFGFSITVSGVIDDVIPLAQELGIKPHTINLSLGIIGKTEKLAEEGIREFTTMCGHAMIAANLVRKGIREVKEGTKTPREASMMMGQPCVCGIFNLDRADLLVTQAAD